MDPKGIFEQVPVELTNLGLVKALLTDISATPSTATKPADGLYDIGTDPTLDLLDLSTAPYLEKHLEYMCSWVDDLVNEQYKFQYYQRQLARSGKDWRKRNKEEGDTDGWASSDAPRRIESLLISQQIRSYCDQMDEFSEGGLGKLFLAGGLQKQEGATK